MYHYGGELTSSSSRNFMMLGSIRTDSDLQKFLLIRNLVKEEKARPNNKQNKKIDCKFENEDLGNRFSIENASNRTLSGINSEKRRLFHFVSESPSSYPSAVFDDERILTNCLTLVEEGRFHRCKGTTPFFTLSCCALFGILIS